MKTKLFLFLSLGFPSHFAYSIVYSVPTTTCQMAAYNSMSSCEAGPTRQEVLVKCPYNDKDGTYAEILRRFDKHLSCAKAFTETVMNSCMKKIEGAADQCVETYVFNSDEADRARQIEREDDIVLGSDAGKLKQQAKVQRIFHEGEQEIAQNSLEKITKAYDKVMRDRDETIKKIEELRPVRSDIDPYNNDSEEKQAEKKNEPSPWQKLADSIMNSRVPVANVQPPVAKVTPELQLPRYQAFGDAGSVARKNGERVVDKSGQSISSSLSESEQAGSNGFEEKQISSHGQLEARASGVSGKVEANSSTLKAATQGAGLGSAVKSGSAVSASEGVYSGAAGALGARSGLRYQGLKAMKGLTVAQLRQKIIDRQKLRTPAQLRFEAGIGQAHGNMFNKIRFRYERLSSTLIP